MTAISRLLYRSRSALVGTTEAIDDAVTALVARSAARNARDGVTGALVFTASTFIQALEGPPASLEAAFERICCDLRHAEVELIAYQKVEERTFPDWGLHQVRGDPSVRAILGAFGAPAAATLKAGQAAEQAVTLMGALTRLEAGAPHAQ